jgi:hypothetical protein
MASGQIKKENFRGMTAEKGRIQLLKIGLTFGIIQHASDCFKQVHFYQRFHGIGLDSQRFSLLFIHAVTVAGANDNRNV